MSQWPIFRLDAPDRSLFYTPGYVVVVDGAYATAFESALDSNPVNGHAAKLLQYARWAQTTWEEYRNRFFYPLCLTLYLNNECNLACGYCFSGSATSGRTTAFLDPESVHAAAGLVAFNCASMNQPLTVVFHGGGEPTLSQHQVQLFLNIIDQVTADYDIKSFKYIATNGVISEKKAAWIASKFDLVGLSCDGPSDIQLANRPLRNGRNSTPFIKRTAEIFRKAKTPFRVRVTITPDSIYRQAEIADYICSQLKPEEVDVEPVYRGGRTSEGDGFTGTQAVSFVDEFIKAQKIAHEYGIPWRTSGSRLNEIHGPYCNIFRDVLGLIPGGVATACFKSVDSIQACQDGTSIGHFDSSTGEFVVEYDRVIRLQQILGQEPARCKACLNRFHCARDCPDFCLLNESEDFTDVTFRCHAQKILAERLLWESVTDMEIYNPGGIDGKELAQRGISL